MFSSGGGKKPPPAQQEMVQVDRSAASESPFFRAPSRDGATKRTTSESGPGLVVGAAYSHADLLKFDTPNLSGSSTSSRPRTPPSIASGRRAQLETATPPSRPTSRHSSPPLKSYVTFLSTTNDDWKADDDEVADDGGLGYEDGRGVAGLGQVGEQQGDLEDDDFGLPGLSIRKRRPRPAATTAATTTPPHHHHHHRRIPDSFGSSHVERRFSNSADIAIERPVAAYPMPKKTEGKILRPQYKDILRDPANALHLINHPSTPSTATQKEMDALNSRISRINKFKRLLQASSVPLQDLRQLAWSGVPEEVRAMTWQLLLSYLPTNSERRVATLERKRKEYLEAVKHLEAAKLAAERGGGGPGGAAAGAAAAGAGAGAAAGVGGGSGPGSWPTASSNSSEAAESSPARGRGLDEAIWHQIRIDVPRTNPHIELYGYETTKRCLERILYVWAVRHPASGYVQGINDLVTPFWQVFLRSYIADPDIESGMDPGQLPKSVLDAAEADSFWCLTKLLDGIQDHYIVAQPGIQRQVRALHDLTARIDGPLARHLEDEQVEFIQFSFRWMNCLLMREISVRNTIRMWDTYLAEEQGFSEFHLYVCAAFLVKWSSRLLKMDFQEIMMFLQSLPTKEWTEQDMELLLSEAFIWQSLFKGSSAHLKGLSSTRTPSEYLQL